MSARCRCRSKVRDRSVLFPRSLPQSTATAFSSRRCVCLLVSASKVEQSQVEQASMSAFSVSLSSLHCRGCILSSLKILLVAAGARRFFIVGCSVFFSSCHLLSRIFPLSSILPTKSCLYWHPPLCPLLRLRFRPLASFSAGGDGYFTQRDSLGVPRGVVG
ncbi:hypothetical protein IWZ00DRAFT_129473 [Phyllosticta capitalensis]